MDVHGHSKKKNLFMYGIAEKGLGKREKVFPILFSKKFASFSYNNCNFVLKKEKENTGRAVMNKEFHIMCSYTLESSFCGAEEGKYGNCHFTPNQL